jgi:hypothetical protein
MTYSFAMITIHIIFTNDRWIYTSLATIFTFIYSILFQIILESENYLPFQKISVYSMIGITTVILCIMAYYSDRKEKLNYCVIN